MAAPLSYLLPDFAEDFLGLAGQGYADGGAALGSVEERVEQVQRDVPAQALLGHVDGRLGADGVVELTGWIGEMGRLSARDPVDNVMCTTIAFGGNKMRTNIADVQLKLPLAVLCRAKMAICFHCGAEF